MLGGEEERKKFGLLAHVLIVLRALFYERENVL